MTLGLLYALACALKLEAQHSNDVAEQSIFSNFFCKWKEQPNKSRQKKATPLKIPKSLCYLIGCCIFAVLIYK